MMPYTERFDDFEILTLRYTILRNCPVAVIWQSPGLPGWRKVILILTVTRRPHHPSIHVAAGMLLSDHFTGISPYSLREVKWHLSPSFTILNQFDYEAKMKEQTVSLPLHSGLRQ